MHEIIFNPINETPDGQNKYSSKLESISHQHDQNKSGFARELADNLKQTIKFDVSDSGVRPARRKKFSLGQLSDDLRTSYSNLRNKYYTAQRDRALRRQTARHRSPFR